MSGLQGASRVCIADHAVSLLARDGKYGLYLDAALVRGSSATCPAYDNEVLCAEEGSQVDKARFECMGLEVWGT